MSSAALNRRTFIYTTGSTPLSIRCGVPLYVLSMFYVAWNINVVFFNLTCSKHLLYIRLSVHLEVRERELAFIFINMVYC